MCRSNTEAYNSANKCTIIAKHHDSLFYFSFYQILVVSISSNNSVLQLRKREKVYL